MGVTAYVITGLCCFAGGFAAGVYRYHRYNENKRRIEKERNRRRFRDLDLYNSRVDVNIQ